MQCVKQYTSKLESIIELLEKYELDVNDAKSMLREIKYFRVTSPVIGNFSTGKSSLINAALGKRLLSVDITPETAVPTEIYYGNNRVQRIASDELLSEDIKIEQLPLKNLSIKDTELVKIEYDCEFLRSIVNVKIVDLPGFDSGIELHNKAIDKYLPNSLAYILVIAIDEPVLKDNIENFISELDLHELPLYIVLTKCARISKEEVEACVNLVNTIVKKILANSDVKIGTTESYGDVDVEDFKSFLYEIQENAMDIFEKRYAPKLIRQLKSLETYFVDQINKSDLSMSELEVQKEELNRGINELINRINKEKENFGQQTEDCIRAIDKKIYSDLDNSVSGLAAMIQNGKNVNERVNTIVRNAVAVGIKTEFEPRLQKYLKKISSMVSIDVTNDEGIKMNLNQIMTDNLIYDVSRKALPFALAAVGTAVAPILGTVVGGLIGAFVDSAVNISQSKIKEKKAQEVAVDIITTVSDQAADAVAREIRSYLGQINEDMEKDILKQKELLDRSLEDVEMRLVIESREKKLQIAEIETDLATVRDMMIL